MLLYSGLGLVVIGEAGRLWAVRHIGVVSRTRIDRAGPLVATGPFRHVRNPLYLGNLGIWIGFALAGASAWLAPIIFGLLALEYHAIVRWEEALLESRLGAAYIAYTQRVPRWLPTAGKPTEGAAAPFSWQSTMYSERGTLLAIAVGTVLVWMKNATGFRL
jgi:protein-S-isoprenylcysteine O-methyltransferase Ste14